MPPVFTRLRPRQRHIVSSRFARVSTISTKREIPILDSLFASEEKNPIHSCDGDGDEFDRQQQSAHDGIGRRWVQDEMEAEEFWSL
jgi:hypothetical protein